MTEDPMLDGLRELGHDARPRGTYNDDVVLGLWLREGLSARLRITRRAEGPWEIASIGVPELDLFVLLDGMSDRDVLRVIDQVLVPLARHHLPEQAPPDQGRDPQSGALSCPEGDGTEGGRGQGAQDSRLPIPPVWAYLLSSCGIYGGIGGILVFATVSEPDGPIDSGWALAGALGCVLLFAGSLAWSVWYAGRLRRRAPR